MSVQKIKSRNREGQEGRKGEKGEKKKSTNDTLKAKILTVINDVSKIREMRFVKSFAYVTNSSSEILKMQHQHSSGTKASIIPKDLLDDIASRFLLDAPDQELKDPISLCFLTELAYWFYLDEYVEEDDSLNTIKFVSFALRFTSTR
ncbi:hypothetical protein Avbf_12222 [Armadillidium vulgare]|nr:hypothetical protein Avbf_12222 [Armadillidium vulgare]